MKAWDSIESDIQWAYYGLRISVAIVGMLPYLYWLYTHFGNNPLPWLGTLSLWISIITIKLVLDILVLPYFYLWAYSQQVDARELRYRLRLGLPFYPIKKWYYPLIPFYSLFEKRIQDITARLQDPSPMPWLNLDNYKPLEVNAERSWYVFTYFLIGIVGVVALAGYVAFDLAIYPQLWSLILLLALIAMAFSAVVRQFFQAPHRIAINDASIMLDNRQYSWDMLRAIDVDRLANTTKVWFLFHDGYSASVPTIFFDAPWEDIIKNIPFYEHREVLAAPLT